MTTKIQIEINESKLKELAHDYLCNQLGEAGAAFGSKDIKILVKSKQNYKSEWEEAAFKASIDLMLS